MIRKSETKMPSLLEHFSQWARVSSRFIAKIRISERKMPNLLEHFSQWAQVSSRLIAKILHSTYFQTIVIIIKIKGEGAARGLLLYNFKILFCHSTQGASPVVGDILKSCARRNAAIGVTYCRVIYPITYCAIIFLFHSVYFLLFINPLFVFLMQS